MNNELLIVKKLEKYIDTIIDEQKRAENQLLWDIINIPGDDKNNNDLIKSAYRKLLPNILFSHTLGKKAEVEQLLRQVYIIDDFWERFALNEINIHDEKIQGNLVETAVDILLKDNDNYMINIGEDILNSIFIPDRRMSIDEYVESIEQLSKFESKTKTMTLIPEYTKNWNGDFGIYNDEKQLLGYIDIKNTNFFNSQKNKYRDDKRIIEDVVLKGIKGVKDWSSVKEIITYILQSLTFDYEKGYKENPTNRELIYIFKDGGYWSSEVLMIIKPVLLDYLKKQINIH